MRITRRGLLAAGMAAVPLGLEGQVRRVGGPRLKLSLAAYSYRDYLQGRRSPNMTYPDFLDAAARLPLDAVELTEYYFPKPITPEFIARIKRQCFLLGLDISGSPMGNVFTHPAGPERDREIGRVREWIDWCAELGAPCIRIFAGNAQPGQSLEQATTCAIECCEIACAHAEKRGVVLALENHGGIVAEADNLLRIARAVHSDFFGINLDTGNFRTEDPYADLERCLPYTVVVQVKTEVSPRGKTKEQADLPRIVQMLRKAGYRGYVTLEYEAAEEPLQAVPRVLAEMRRLLDAA